jgi:hypothetical protein
LSAWSDEFASFGIDTVGKPHLYIKLKFRNGKRILSNLDENTDSQFGKY